MPAGHGLDGKDKKMKEAILMSIHKKYADLIYSGKKRLEIRKTAPFVTQGRRGQITPKYPVKVLLYETKANGGAGKITGYFICDHILTAIYYEAFVAGSCLTLRELMDYAGGADKLHALHIASAERYDTPQTLSSYGLNKAPQSWRYLTINDTN